MADDRFSLFRNMVPADAMPAVMKAIRGSASLSERYDTGSFFEKQHMANVLWLGSQGKIPAAEVPMILDAVYEVFGGRREKYFANITKDWSDDSYDIEEIMPKNTAMGDLSIVGVYRITVKNNPISAFEARTQRTSAKTADFSVLVIEAFDEVAPPDEAHRCVYRHIRFEKGFRFSAFRGKDYDMTADERKAIYG